MAKEKSIALATEPSAPKKVRTRHTEPVCVTIEVADQEEVASIVGRAHHRTELSRRLDDLEIGTGLKIQGDFVRVRSAVSAFSQKNTKRFSVGRNSAGVIIVARVEDKKPENDNNGE